MNRIQRSNTATRRGVARTALLAGWIALATSPVRAVIFDNPQNVDLLNSDNVTVTTGPGTSSGQNLIGYVDDPGYWEGGPGNIANDAITINLGQVRNVKTIKTSSVYGVFEMASATVETALSLAGPWTVAPTTVSLSTGTDFDTVLNTAANTQFLRFTPTSYQNLSRIVLNDFRVFSDVGAAVGSGPHLDVISSTAYSAPGAVTVSSTGGLLVGNPADDSTMTRKVVYSLDSGDSVKIAFDRGITFDEFGYAPTAFHDSSPLYHWQLWGSTDGTTFSTLLLDQTGVEPSVPTFYAFSRFTGTALRFDVVNQTVGTDFSALRIAEFFAFEAVPEPSMLLLLAVGGLVVRRQMRARRG